MVQRKGGMRRKTRSLFRKTLREKGEVPIRSYLQEFEIGDKVAMVIEPSIQEGVFHKRFHGKGGKITGKAGKCYTVVFSDFNKTKTIIAHPVHLKKIR